MSSTLRKSSPPGGELVDLRVVPGRVRRDGSGSGRSCQGSRRIRGRGRRCRGPCTWVPSTGRLFSTAMRGMPRIMCTPEFQTQGVSPCFGDRSEAAAVGPMTGNRCGSGQLPAVFVEDERRVLVVAVGAGRSGSYQSMSMTSVSHPGVQQVFGHEPRVGEHPRPR